MDLNNRFKKWTDNEIKDLINEYNEKKLDINEIAKLHQRSSCGISYKLVEQKLVKDRNDCRGFDRKNMRKLRKPKLNYDMISLFETIFEIKSLLIDIKHMIEDNNNDIISDEEVEIS